MASRAYCGRFNFNGQDQQKKVGNPCRGERGRLHLAKTLIQGGNVLLLDEPSNDLDVGNPARPEDALLGIRRHGAGDQPRPLVPGPHRHPYPGSRRDSQWVFFDGNYQEYEADKKRRLAKRARPRSACATRRPNTRREM